MKTYIYKLVVAMFLFAGIGCVTVNDGSDPLVVRAEQIAESAYGAMDAFVSWEFRNRFILSSDVKAQADLVREFGPRYLLAVRAATKAYKQSRTQPDADQLQLAIAQLQSLLDDARRYYIEKEKP